MLRYSPARIALWGVVLGSSMCLLTGVGARAAEPKKAVEPKKTDAKKTEPKSSFGSGAEGVNTTTGKVVSVGPLSVELSGDGRNVTFYTTKKSSDIVPLLSQLAPPDNVTITWAQKSGRKWIQKIEGSDTVEGTVAVRNDLGLVVVPDNGGPQVVYFPWAGATPEELAKLDKKAMKQISRVKVGDEVRMTWEISDAKRITEMKVLERAPGQKNPRAAAKQGHLHYSGPSAAGIIGRARRMVKQ
jgi:hypothetical protein